jgi:hypothetical protein
MLSFSLSYLESEDASEAGVFDGNNSYLSSL